ncbi:cell division protein FtsK [Paenibacillus yonginensis]|uniref:Cell division protein FtsK n=1 Tax=Paenibacillus yonginensis TaxID=1462996 RepID=A0A1B1MY24_9BACL|nr:DNA translocase FtsK 4TM domain-containing protein [Paenibacillus yonginensis]ANS74057.1 cell division protein FtsK [Paenibacillus yonginensis]
MAGKKRKRKKTALTRILKYEIYGIILITLSIIALSGEAAVGRSLSKMAALMLGKFYFVIPLIGIYAGLTVMIQRHWPNKWTSRKSGLVLVVLSFALMSTISAMELKLTPVGALTPNHIFNQTRIDLQQALSMPGYGGAVSIFKLDISGGYIGAAEFALLSMLFGLTGSKLILIVMFAISFMLITNLSFVELGRLVRTRVFNLGEVISRKLRTLRAVPAGQKRKAKPAAVKASAAPAFDPDDDDEDYDPESEIPSGPAAPKKPVFFQLLGFKGNRQERQPLMDEADLDAPFEDNASPAIITGPASDTADSVDWNEVKFSGGFDRTEPAAELNPRQEEERGLIIRDFFDHIRKENGDYEDDHEETFYSSVAEHGNRVGQDYGAGDESGYEGPQANSPVNQEQEEVFGQHGEGASGMDLEEEDTLNPGSAAIKEEGTAGGAGSGEHAEQPAQAEPPKPKPKPYKLPPFRLLERPSDGNKGGDQADYMNTARKLEATLESFGVRARVLEVVRGPAVTRYEIQPDIGVKVSRIVNLTDDIALALAAKDIRMEAPIPGKSAIGIEVPNSEVSIVTMREVMETATFQKAESKLSIAFGRDISGQTIVGNLAKMPHLLVAGATGSGKSVCINGIITSILFKAKPDEVKFMMVDPKMVELNVYNGIPHLLAPVVTDPKRASLALKKIVVEMEKRYEKFSKSGTRNIEGYNNLMKDNPDAILPYIVVIVDELADLMMVAANDVEDAIARLAQMARAAGIHLIIATQRPSVDVITGVIKANIPSRIAFGVSSQVDSRTILDMAGAEKLLGRGDMLFMPMGASKPVRVQGAFMSDQEVETIVQYVSSQGQAEYDESLVPEVDDTQQEMEEVLDELYDQAVQIILEAKQASVSLLQRRMRIGYTRAARLIDSMEARGIVGPYEGSKPREVLVSAEQYNQNRISS